MRPMRAGGASASAILAFPMHATNDAKPACPHKRTQVIAKDNDAQYVECLDCGEILEVGELPAGESSGESLSDA
jgi:hypothetical protein